MKVIHFNDAESYELDAGWKRWSLCAEDSISIEHFAKPAGHASPEHDHPNAQVLVVLEGKITVRGGDTTECELGVGDAVYIPGGETHVVTNPLDRPSIGLDIFVPGRPFDFWLKRKPGGAS